MQKITSLLILVFLPLSSSFAVTFDLSCKPMYSSVERVGFGASTEVQGYSWSFLNKVLPDTFSKRVDGLTFLGCEMSTAYGYTDRWSHLVEDMHQECQRHRWIIGTLEGSESCTSDLFKERKGGFAEITLHENYCHPANISKVKDIFSPNADVPAQFINLWDEDYLRNYYVSSNEALDLENFFQLNLEAEKIWNKIVKCEEGDVERARMAIASGKFSCNEEGGIKDQFRILLANITNYFSSPRALNFPLYDSFNGKIIYGAISNDSPLLASFDKWDGIDSYLKKMAWDGKSRNYVGQLLEGNRVQKYYDQRTLGLQYYGLQEKTAEKYPQLSLEKILENRVQIHPLFSQMALEILSAQFLSTSLVDDFGRLFGDTGDTRKDARRFSDGMKNLNNNLSNFSLVYLERMCAPVGLWPSAGFSAMLHIQRKISLGLPLSNHKTFALQRPDPDRSADFMRIGYWSFDLEKAQLNCIRDKILPDLYYKDVKSIVRQYRDMFRRHIAE